MSLQVTPGSGAFLISDLVGGNHVQSIRELEFSGWTDIIYKSVISPTTAEVCKTSTPCRGLYIIAHPNNSNPIAVGPSPLTNATSFRGFPIYAGGSQPFPVNNTNLVYIDNKSGDLWSVIYFTHSDS